MLCLAINKEDLVEWVLRPYPLTTPIFTNADQGIRLPQLP
jgi:hypothetical protein